MVLYIGLNERSVIIIMNRDNRDKVYLNRIIEIVVSLIDRSWVPIVLLSLKYG